MENPKKLHPSPDKFREKWYNLNGEWDFSFDKPDFDRKIRVPFSWASPLSMIGEKDKKGVGYYRRYVKYENTERLFIVFGGVDYEAAVYVNGSLVKEHTGGYGQFEADITDLWKTDCENEIIVKATDTDVFDQLYGKQGYGDARGIWQSVWLEERAASYIDKFKVTTKINGEVRYEITPSSHFTKFEVEVDGKTFSTEESVIDFKIDSPKLWSTDEPNLYDCTLRLYSDCGTDEVKTYFGIREVGTLKIDDKRYITINGKPIYVMAALDQSFNKDGFFTFPYDDYNREEIMRAKDLGLNTIRIHIKTEEKLKLYWADKIGMLVIEDIPCFWGEPNEVARERYEREMYEIIDRDINHPSVFFWVVFNETWGLKHFEDGDETKWEYRRSTQEWVRGIYRAVKAYDPTRLVEDNSPCNRDHVETDVNTWHTYANGYKSVKYGLKRVANTFVPGSGENFTEGNVMGDVPVMNSECGNYWGITGGAGDSDISWHYKYMINEFRLQDRICGFVFTELKDVINEFNGYYRLDDSKKYFGYDFFNEAMSIKDLHSEDYLGFDRAPMATVAKGENISIPLFISSFTDKHHGKAMRVIYKTELETGINGRRSLDEGSIDITYNKYGTTFISPLEITAPEKSGILIVKLYLTDSEDDLVMSNYILFDIDGGERGSVKLEDIKTSGFKRAWLVQEGNKLNCIGDGAISFTVSKKDLGPGGGEIVFEASSREELQKDIRSKTDGEGKTDLDLFRGYFEERDTNPNSFYMTDDEKHASKIEVYAGHIKLCDLILEDDPADSSGSLSWHYQISDKHLDEAGSYGYLCRVKIDKDTLAFLPESFDINIKVTDSLSIFGRRSGRYPIGVEIV